jgi:hypothetical protein
MTPDLDDAAELSAWMDDWRAEESGPTAAPADIDALLRRVKRRTLGLKLLTAGEVLLVTAALVYVTVFALHHPHPLDLAAMSSLGLLAVGALLFSLWNRRGLWSPLAETTAAYLALARTRVQRRREALRAGRWLLIGETAVFIPWIWHRLHLGAGQPSALDYALAYGYLAFVVAVTAAVLAWLERWTRRELAELPQHK